MEITRKATPSESLNELEKSSITSIRKLQNYLSRIRDDVVQELQGKKLVYLLDWDIIRQGSIEVNRPSGLFACAILSGLLNGTSAKVGIAVPKGSKIELYNHLVYRRKHLFSSIGVKPSKEVEYLKKFQRSFKGVYKSDTWLENEKRTAFLKIHDSKIERLDNLLSKYTKSFEVILGDDAKKLNQTKTNNFYPHFFAELEEQRPEHKMRNEADALNLSIIKSLKKLGYNVYLVSGTKILPEIYPEGVVDPLYFFLSLNLRNEYSGNLENLIDYLDMALRQTGQIIIKSRYVKKIIGNKKNKTNFATKNEINEFKDEIENWLQGALKNSILNIFSNAITETKNRWEMLRGDKSNRYKDINSDCFVGDIYNNPRIERINSLLRNIGLDGIDNISDLGCMVDKKESEILSVYTILSPTNAKIVKIEKAKNFKAFSWRTMVSHNEFIEIAMPLIERNSCIKNETNLCIQYDESASEYLSVNRYKEKGLPNKQKRVGGIKLLCSSIQLYYELGDNNLESSPNISIVIKSQHEKAHENLTLLTRIFNLTSCEYIPEELLIKTLDEL